MEKVVNEGARARYLAAVAFLGIAFSFVANAWLALQPSYYMVVNYNMGYVGCALSLAPLSFLGIFSFTFLGRFWKGRPNLETLTVVYCVAMMTAFLCNHYYPWYVPGSVFTSRAIEPDLSIKYFPWYMAPSKGVITDMIYGSPSIPVAEWLPSLLFWSIFQWVFGIFSVSMAAVLRRSWLDIEKLPFPHTEIMYTFVSKASGERGGSLLHRLGSRLAIGMLIGLAVQVPIFMTFVFPWFPDVYAWKVNNCYFGATWVTPESPLAPVAGFQTFNKWPPFYALFYLVPAFVLKSYLVSFLVYLILTQIFYSMGYYTGLLENPGCGRNWCPPNPGQSPPIKWFAVANIGGPIGLALWYVIMNRSYLLTTLKAAIGRLDEAENLESKEAISYRSAWIMLIGSAIGIVAFFSVIAPPQSANGLVAILIVPLVCFVWNMGARVFAYTGFNGVVYSGAGTAFVWSIWPQQPVPITEEWFTHMFMQRTLITDGSYGYGWSGVFPAVLSSFKMAEFTGTSNRKIAEVVLVVLLVVPFSSLLSMVALSHAFGASRFAEYADMGSNVVMRFAYEGSHESWPAKSTYQFEVAFGIVMVGLLSYLHSRFLWFPIEPVGWLMSI
ncbi:MAG: DUF6785 family protein, partial [Thermoproteota archaeon]